MSKRAVKLLEEAPGMALGSERNCSVGRTIAILSDAWSFLVIREAFFGARRFEDFRFALGLPRGTLADRLRRLTQQGIFAQAPRVPGSTRAEYRLTECGFELYPIFVALIGFGDRWLAGNGKPPVALVHGVCGKECHPVVACSHCLGALKATRVRYRDGPGAGRTPLEGVRRTPRTAGNFSRGRPSSVSRALEIIGDRWTFLIVREAFFGVRRFDQLQGELGIAPNILVDRLSRLVLRGVFERRKYQAGPDRYEYRLTEMGKDLYGAFVAMAAWGDRWYSRGKPPLLLTHLDCGKDFAAAVICDHCKTPVEARSMTYRMNYDASKYAPPEAAD